MLLLFSSYELQDVAVSFLWCKVEISCTEAVVSMERPLLLALNIYFCVSYCYISITSGGFHFYGKIHFLIGKRKKGISVVAL